MPRTTLGLRDRCPKEQKADLLLTSAAFREVDSQDALFYRLSLAYPTPAAVQWLLRTFPYNAEENGLTMRSARETWRAKTAHCLEAAFLAAAILERRGYPSLVLSLESQDDLDHVVFAFRADTGWGAIGRSREEGLNGREPVFRSIRDLAWSYFDPYVDNTGKITGYRLANLDDSRAPWRDSDRNVWKAEQYLIDLPHRPLHSSARRYERLLGEYLRDELPHANERWW